MKKKEIKKLTKDEILKNLEKSKKDLFNFRFQKINGQMTLIWSLKKLVVHF
mgnify:CR=1 FL=1